MGSYLWSAILVTLFIKSLQHGTIVKPKSANGCYHGDEGTFFWAISGDDLYLNITATIKETEWVAVGFSNDTLMGYDDIVAVFKDSYTQSFIAAPLFDPHGYSSTIFQEELETIADSSITYKDGIVQANITKSIELSYPFDTLHKTPVYLMFGIGNIRPVDEGGDVKPLYMHHVNPTVSRDLVPLYRNTPRCISSQTHNLIKVHGILMVLVWLNLTPLSVFIARYAKYYFKRQTLWFTIHKYTGYLSGILVVAAVTVAYIALETIELERHQLLGISVLVVLVVHIIMAIFRPPHEARFRRLWEVVHKISAGLLFIGSITNIVNGLSMLNAHESCYYVISTQITVYCILFIVLENPQQVGRFMSKVCICLRISPHFYYSLNTQYKDDSDDTDCDDITMVTMDLDNTGSRSTFVQFGLCTAVVINSVVSVTIISALVNT